MNKSSKMILKVIILIVTTGLARAQEDATYIPPNDTINSAQRQGFNLEQELTEKTIDQQNVDSVRNSDFGVELPFGTKINSFSIEEQTQYPENIPETPVLVEEDINEATSNQEINSEQNLKLNENSGIVTQDDVISNQQNELSLIETVPSKSEQIESSIIEQNIYQTGADATFSNDPTLLSNQENDASIAAIDTNIYNEEDISSSIGESDLIRNEESLPTVDESTADSFSNVPTFEETSTIDNSKPISFPIQNKIEQTETIVNNNPISFPIQNDNINQNPVQNVMNDNTELPSTETYENSEFSEQNFDYNDLSQQRFSEDINQGPQNFDTTVIFVENYTDIPIENVEEDLQPNFEVNSIKNVQVDDSYEENIIIDPIEALKRSIVGVPGEDYPILHDIPETSFTCDGVPGYYADTSDIARCQVFHICQENEQHSFLCPNGTVFNQQYFVCDWWYNFDCSLAPNYFDLNNNFGLIITSQNNYEQTTIGFDNDVNEGAITRDDNTNEVVNVEDAFTEQFLANPNAIFEQNSIANPGPTFEQVATSQSDAFNENINPSFSFVPTTINSDTQDETFEEEFENTSNLNIVTENSENLYVADEIFSNNSPSLSENTAQHLLSNEETVDLNPSLQPAEENKEVFQELENDIDPQAIVAQNVNSSINIENTIPEDQSAMALSDFLSNPGVVDPAPLFDEMFVKIDDNIGVQNLQQNSIPETDDYVQVESLNEEPVTDNIEDYDNSALNGLLVTNTLFDDETSVKTEENNLDSPINVDDFENNINQEQTFLSISQDHEPQTEPSTIALEDMKEIQPETMLNQQVGIQLEDTSSQQQLFSQNEDLPIIMSTQQDMSSQVPLFQVSTEEKIADHQIGLNLEETLPQSQNLQQEDQTVILPTGVTLDFDLTNEFNGEISNEVTFEEPSNQNSVGFEGSSPNQVLPQMIFVTNNNDGIALEEAAPQGSVVMSLGEMISLMRQNLNTGIPLSETKPQKNVETADLSTNSFSEDLSNIQVMMIKGNSQHLISQLSPNEEIDTLNVIGNDVSIENESIPVSAQSPVSPVNINDNFVPPNPVSQQIVSEDFPQFQNSVAVTQSSILPLTISRLYQTPYNT